MPQHGAHNRNRTGDLFLTKEVLYRLSYVGFYTLLLLLRYTKNMERVMGIEPTLSAWKAEILPLNYTRLSKPLICDYSASATKNYASSFCYEKRNGRLLYQSTICSPVTSSHNKNTLAFLWQNLIDISHFK